MPKLMISATVLALSVLSAHSETGDCLPQGCKAEYLLTSASGMRSYGILIAAPESGCPRVRFRVETASARFLGHTPPLAPGELAVVRLGRGFATGDHVLSIASEGCAGFPAATRQVAFAKRSPDHGWRAAR